MKHVALLVLVVCGTAIAFGQAKATTSAPVTFVNSPEINLPPGFSQTAVISSGKLIFVSGMVGLDKQGQMTGKEDFRAQVTQTFANMKAALAAAGAKPEHIVKLTYYVVGLSKERLTAIREVRNSIVNTTNPPTSTLVGVAALFREDAQIEIDAVAVIP